jgi:nucleotide-binding universal stress UspA family protein
MNIETNVQSDVVFRHIVVPHDLTLHADKALQMAGTMAHPQLSRVVLLNVIDPGEVPKDESGDFISEVGELARHRWRLLTFAARRLLPADVKVEVRVLSGNPQDVILEEVQNLGADLLVTTTHPRTGAGYPFHGWSDEHVQSKASCPVLIIPVSEENGASIGMPKLRELETHSLAQYCELSRRLAKESTRRPVFIGYAHLPSSPLGVCEEKP